MKFAVLQFPGSNCDQDCVHVLGNILGREASLRWHKETDLNGFDAVIVPGGFSYGDYLRTGAIARFSPIMQAVKQFADNGGPVLGICNGFQILCEAGLLPGALIRNRSLQFRCEYVHLKVVNDQTAFTSRSPRGSILRIPIAHGDGCYYCDDDTLTSLKQNGQILWQYVDANGAAVETANPNGSLENIAGVSNARGNVAGLMPHPERASESILGESGGLVIFESLVAHLETGKPVFAA